MKRMLSIETSGRAASAAVTEGGRLIAQSFQNCGLTHSETLLPMITAMLNTSKTALSDISMIACAVGPGSFTGLRIGIAAAQGLAWGRDIPCAGVSSLDALAHTAALNSGIICCALDARRGQVYRSVYESDGKVPSVLVADGAVSLEELHHELSMYKQKVFFVGDGAELCYNYLIPFGMDCALAPEHLRFQSASGVALAAVSVTPRPFYELLPVYLRLPQAERERLKARSQSAGHGSSQL